MKEPTSYENELHLLTHFKTDIDKILIPLKVRVNDELRIQNKRCIATLDKGAELAAKYIFLEKHFSLYIDEIFKTKTYPGDNYFHIKDQFQEAKLEVIHSLLLARVGMLKQAINTLRRCFEAAVYGSFYCTTSSYGNIHYLGSTRVKRNPFVVLTGYGLWAARAGNFSVRFSELKPVIKNISNQKNISKRQSTHLILSNFTEYYLENFSKPLCKNHYGIDKNLLYSLSSSNSKSCEVCGTQTCAVLVERPITVGLMIAVLDVKLRRNTDSFIDMDNLYAKLSTFVHPNPASHQHEPDFKLSDIRKWLHLMQETLRVMIWLYVRSIQCIGYDEAHTTTLIDAKKYDLSKVRLNDLITGICKKIGDKYLNPQII
jgi:hypothetical protein